ncbi:translation protein SH3-like domain-containing protein [Biscogniauxia mediterranea]|nr:translation protein SH3-like domain-containing protein [Biscogniauxia mediterranea]
MIPQSASRPLGSWKAVLRRAHQQRQLLLRAMTTETTPTSSMPPPPPPPPSTATPAKKVAFHVIKSTVPHKPVRTAFAVYPRAPSARATNPEALKAFHAQQVRRLDKTGARTALFSKANPDAAKPGDVLQVTTNRGGEPFAGVCLSIRRAGVDTAILLRNQLTKIGVEMWFKIYSPTVTGIEIIWRRPKRARRARLTYMRKPKHDMGNVDHLVDAWRRTRNVFTSGKSAKGRQNLGRPGKYASTKRGR